IPDRYVLLRKDQVKDFKEDQLEVFTPKKLSGRAQRQMTVYYNVLNILGDRMGRYPETVVRLTGASLEGPKVGLQMAESVKIYLVDVFGIDGLRIATEGRTKPRIPSEQHYGSNEMALLREGDNRVSVWSESPALMMEFQSGPDAPMKPIEISSVQEAPLDSYVTFNVAGAEDAFVSWSLVVVDEKGQMQYFGPYTKEKASIPGKSILGTRSEGDYKITMIGQGKSGKVVKKEASAHMVLWTPPKNEEMMRFSVIYEFNNSNAIDIYDKYLTEVVIPKIPKDAKVLIHGHTDIIGDKEYNQDLSVARANDVRTILEKGLASAGRTDVRFEVLGFGENLNEAPFDNKYPEERFYNRTVIIDIIPAN
ncbi:MAG TPA: OmpA family protein, partial [Prolixibacteraceae bacterium]|nr:OmpA family protein [Prolixibacteraceae bacterium]